jgi:methylated-DNA-[protein]-cysteine S-methyltransferase
MKNVFFYKTDIGRIGIAEENNLITNVSFETDAALDYYVNETVLLREASTQLYKYLDGKLKQFSLPLSPQGTPFMKNVWDCLCNIPYGETVTYKDIAKAVGNERASRAVGLANNRNPVPIFVPCHRVIGSNGKLVGYRGGIQTKINLLELEKRYANI